MRLCCPGAGEICKFYCLCISQWGRKKFSPIAEAFIPTARKDIIYIDFEQLTGETILTTYEISHIMRVCVKKKS